MPDTPLPVWPHGESPFHEGELAVQRRVGVDAKLDLVGRKVIRNVMPDQHRQFFEQLPFLLAGSVDGDGQPWASVLAGKPGFAHAPTERQLDIRATALQADPLYHTLRPGASIGLLGIEPHTRRRNRMNGTVTRVGAEGFSVTVNRSFGNCPKYIQAREPALLDAGAMQEAGEPVRASALDARMRDMIREADTFFIATAIRDESQGDAPPHGADISHRGGKPGFVRVDGDATLTVPDFVGNFFFNTLGNIVTNPRAGLLFIDFNTGDLLYLAARAEIIWEGPEVASFTGAQRLLRFSVTQAVIVPRSLPLRWGPATLSPVLDATGSWETGK